MSAELPDHGKEPQTTKFPGPNVSWKSKGRGRLLG